jgi:broad specificity phosphatase PhoE
LIRQSTTVNTVLLARHGESEFSVQGLTNGDPAVTCGLTERGRAEARLLGRQLAEAPLDLCVVSEFPRARETAELAVAGRDVPLLVLPGLNDIRFGAYEGKLLADYRAWARSHGPEEAAPGGGDSRAATVARYAAAFTTILARPERAVLVVAHSLPVRYVLDAAAGITPGPVVEQVPYAEAFRLEATQLTQAVDLLESWAREPTWPS